MRSFARCSMLSKFFVNDDSSKLNGINSFRRGRQFIEWKMKWLFSVVVARFSREILADRPWKVSDLNIRNRRKKSSKSRIKSWTRRFHRSLEFLRIPKTISVRWKDRAAKIWHKNWIEKNAPKSEIEKKLTKSRRIKWNLEKLSFSRFSLGKRKCNERPEKVRG